MSTRAKSYTLSFIAAAALHVGVLYGWGKLMHSPPEYAISAGESIELTLLDAPAEELEAVPETELLPSHEPEIHPPEETPPPEAPPETAVPPEPEPEPVQEPEPEPEPVLPVKEPRAREKPKPAPASKPQTAPLPRPAAVSTRTATSTTGQPGKAGARSGTSGARVLARPNYLRNPPPKYPPASRQAKEQGVVVLVVAVTADGHAGTVRLKRSSGFARLDEAALNAVRGWRFSPGSLGGFPVASEVEVPVRFNLR